MRFKRDLRKGKLLPLLLLAFLLAGSAAYADRISASWEGGNGSWSNMNWEESLPCRGPDCDYRGPNGGNYDVLIDSPATINVDVNVSVNSVTSAGTASLVLNGTSLSVPTQIATLASAQLSNGASITTPHLVTHKLTAQNSTVTASVVVSTASGNGVVNLSGSHVDGLSLAGQLTLSNGSIGGGAGLNLLELLAPSSMTNSTLKNAFVAVDKGASLDVSGGSQINIVAAPGVTYGLQVGAVNQGSMNVKAGSQITVAKGAQTLIGGAAGSKGSLTLDGSGTSLTLNDQITLGLQSQSNGSLTLQNGAAILGDPVVVVGEGGSGKLTVQNNADFIPLASLGVGENAGSSGEVIVSSGKGIGSFDIDVGDEGAGLLTIENGARVNDISGVVGLATGGTGTVLVTGARSVWDNSTLQVGVIGTGFLTVSSGGLVSAGTVGDPGTITIGPHGTVNDKGGTLQGSVILQKGGVLDPLGVANITGGFTMNAGSTLALDVAGAGPGQLGVLDVSGRGVFDGTLIVDFINGFAPTKGDTFDLINDPGGAGFSLAGINILGLKPGFEYTTKFAGGQFTLTALNNGNPIPGATPEPASLVLLGSGLVGVGGLVRAYRRRSR